MTDETRHGRASRYGRGSRRQFLAVTGGTLLGVTSLGAAQQTTTSTASTPAQRFRFGGRVQAWEGRTPQSIQGQSNPTLQLQVGRVYEVTWENLDGQPHNFALQNEDGRDLSVIFPDVQSGTADQTTRTTTGDGTTGTAAGGTVTPPDDAISVTETISQQGATQTLRFVVTQDVAQYICTIHPTTMVGDVELQDGGEEGGGDGGTGGNGDGGMGGGGGGTGGGDGGGGQGGGGMGGGDGGMGGGDGGMGGGDGQGGDGGMGGNGDGGMGGDGNDGGGY